MSKKSKNNHRLILLVIGFTLILLRVTSQVLIQFQPPPQGTFYVEDLYHSLSLINTGNQTYQVYLTVTATEVEKGMIYEGTTSVFELPPGFKFVEYDEIEPVDVTYPNEQYREIIQKTGSIPYGKYHICIVVINAETGTTLGEDCFDQEVYHPDPPRLLYPSDGASITDDFPYFTWTPPVPVEPSRTVIYNLRIVEILASQSPEDAISGNPAWYNETGFDYTFFQYPVDAREMTSARRYGWQVEAVIDDISAGFSEIYTFVKETLDLSDTLMAAPAAQPDSVVVKP